MKATEDREAPMIGSGKAETLGGRSVHLPGPARESWLTSDEPEKYAAAMMKCRHPFALCSADGYCHRRWESGDNCFVPNRREALEIRVERLERKVESLLAAAEVSDV